MTGLRDAIYGLAVGDALGVPAEFHERGSYTLRDMTGHGTYDKKAGTWSDDTAMTLATCDSIRMNGGRVDPISIQRCFKDWLYGGKYAIDGEVFDVGNTVATALNTGRGQDSVMSNGNGSLMRIIPLAFVDGITDEQIEQVSSITHAHKLSVEGCLIYVHFALDLLSGDSLKSAVDRLPDRGDYHRLRGIEDVALDDIQSTGYIVDTLEAALWSLTNTDNYRDCVLTCANMGNDTDTIAAVAGALAGIIYGYEAIPDEWIAKLKGKDIIESCLF